MKTALPFSLLLILTLSTLSFLTACRHSGNTVYSRFGEIGNEGWNPADGLSFMPWPCDSVVGEDDRFSVVVCVRKHPQETLEYLPLLVAEEDNFTTSPSTDTISINLRPSRKGRIPVGVMEVNDTIRRGLRLRDGYMITLYPLIRQEATSNLVDIGVLLVKETAK